MFNKRPLEKISFVNFHEKGLDPLITMFNLGGVEVDTLKSNNIAKRESGVSVKTADVTFKSGQKLQLKIKANGTIFQAKLNGKVVPIKQDVDLPTVLVGVAKTVKESEAAYLKRKEKRLERAAAAAKKGLDSPAVKTSTKAMIEELSASVAEQKEAFGGVQEQLAETTSELEKKRQILADLQKQEAELIAERDALLDELQNMEAA